MTPAKQRALISGGDENQNRLLAEIEEAVEEGTCEEVNALNAMEDKALVNVALQNEGTES